ncbi:MAG: radical SAM protein [Phycisphaeraceae bacterium]
MEGIVFDIQRSALHDGPGLRTAVFLKGCPLRCAWCHNPESQRPGIEQGRSGKVYGEVMTVEAVMDVVRLDRAYYEASGGGVTLTGGEPTMQYDFCRALLEAAKAEGIHTCLDTCGQVPTDRLLALAPLVDVFHYDLKLTGDAEHRRWTGVDGRLIRRNLEALREAGARIILRCPIIPGVNDDPQHLAALDALERSAPAFEAVERLDYHASAAAKYDDLGREPPRFSKE